MIACLNVFTRPTIYVPVNHIHHLVNRSDPAILRRRPELEAGNWKVCDYEGENRVYWLWYNDYLGYSSKGPRCIEKGRVKSEI
jgi:hypothetical protein